MISVYLRTHTPGWWYIRDIVYEYYYYAEY